MLFFWAELGECFFVAAVHSLVLVVVETGAGLDLPWCRLHVSNISLVILGARHKGMRRAPSSFPQETCECRAPSRGLLAHLHRMNASVGCGCLWFAVEGSWDRLRSDAASPPETGQPSRLVARGKAPKLNPQMANQSHIPSFQTNGQTILCQNP